MMIAPAGVGGGGGGGSNPDFALISSHDFIEFIFVNEINAGDAHAVFSESFLL